MSKTDALFKILKFIKDNGTEKALKKYGAKDVNDAKDYEAEMIMDEDVMRTEASETVRDMGGFKSGGFATKNKKPRGVGVAMRGYGKALK